MADTTETGLPRAVAVAWGMQEAPQRGPSRGLSHEAIVAAAVEIADAEGLSAVTMQAVAESLGFTTMSLYRYVSGKDELLRLMQDAALRIPDDVVLDDDWRVAVRQWAGLLRAACRAHPWALEIPRDQTSVMMPGSVAAADVGLRALRSLDLSDRDRVGVILVVAQHVVGMVELEQSLAREGEVAISPAGVALLAGAISPERFPYVAPLVVTGVYVPDGEPDAIDAGDVDAEYDLGLELIVAGLEALQQRRSGAGTT